jgi:hypothetical protein
MALYRDWYQESSFQTDKYQEHYQISSKMSAIAQTRKKHPLIL